MVIGFNACTIWNAPAISPVAKWSDHPPAKPQPAKCLGLIFWKHGTANMGENIIPVGFISHITVLKTVISSY
jgi:hypothetical protein